MRKELFEFNYFDKLTIMPNMLLETPKTVAEWYENAVDRSELDFG